MKPKNVFGTRNVSRAGPTDFFEMFQHQWLSLGGCLIGILFLLHYDERYAANECCIGGGINSRCVCCLMKVMGVISDCGVHWSWCFCYKFRSLTETNNGGFALCHFQGSYFKCVSLH